MLAELGAWWNAVELWVVQLWFPLQFAVVMVVVLPLCVGVAVGAERLFDVVAKRERGRPTRP